MKLTKTKIDKIEKYTNSGLYKNQYTKVSYTNMKAINDCNSIIFLYDIPRNFIENTKIEKYMTLYFDRILNGYEKILLICIILISKIKTVDIHLIKNLLIKLLVF